MPRSSENIHLHIWCPNMNGLKGGIQVYSSFFVEAVREFRPAVNCTLFVKHDPANLPDDPPTANLPGVTFHSAGTWPPVLRTSAFATQITARGLWQRPDLIISTHLNFTRAAHWLKLIAGIPYWAVAHGIEAWDIKQPSLRFAVLNADRIFAVSNYTRNRLIENLEIEADKVSLLPDTFDSNRFTITAKPEYLLRRYGLKPNQPVILTVSRLVASEQYKGYDRIIMGLPEIRRSIPDVRYIIVGGGDDHSRVEALISRLNLQGQVTLTGYVPDDELCDHYNLCDVFAMPSKGEGFGIVFLEALGCGKPTLAGNKDGSVDALYNGELGALVDPDDVDEIARTLTRILQRAYSHPLMYKPEVLRQRAIDVYGFNSFKQMLSSQLEQFFSAKSLQKQVLGEGR
jgi:glycosyltransferase involved in cell wall biosynthesis